MDKDTIIRLAREVWDKPNWNEPQIERLERFAALVAAQTREECAKVCEALQDWPEDATPYDCAAAIRSRT